MSKKLRLSLALLFALAVSAVILLNRQFIRDQYMVRTNELTPAAESLRQQIKLTNNSNFVYRASVPQVYDSTQFNQACRSAGQEHSIVLGCYTKQRIFIFNVTDERLNGVQQVTAAHELLHAEYDRMPSKEKARINQLLRTTAESITDERFKSTLAEYKRTEPDQIDNELHSIIGTEIAVIPSELEAHYRQYFTDRQAIVRYAESYAGTFNELSDQIKQYDSQLADLKGTKDSLEMTLNSQQNQIESERQRLNQLRSSGDVDSYNSAVPAYNELVRQYNNNIQEVRSIISQYNTLVAERNELATTQNDLSRQLDSSSYQTIN